MIRTRNVRFAASLVLGAAVLAGTTGCGGPMQAGAAAVIQGERTTDAQVQTNVSQIVALAEKHGLATDATFTDAERAGLGRAQISLLVQQAVWQRAADDLHLTVTADQDAKVKASIVADARAALGPGFSGSDAEAVATQDFVNSQQGNAVGLAPGSLNVLAHTEALYEVVVANQANKLGVSPGVQSPELQSALIALLGKAAQEINVKISPRYGTYDAALRRVKPAHDPWLKPTDAQLAAAAAALQQQSQ